jgi:hypothetical protein
VGLKTFTMSPESPNVTELLAAGPILVGYNGFESVDGGMSCIGACGRDGEYG